MSYFDSNSVLTDWNKSKSTFKNQTKCEQNDLSKLACKVYFLKEEWDIFHPQKHFANFKTMRSLFLCCKERIIISLLYYVGILLFLLFRMKCCYLISHTTHTVTRIRSDFYILFKNWASSTIHILVVFYDLYLFS